MGNQSGKYTKPKPSPGAATSTHGRQASYRGNPVIDPSPTGSHVPGYSEGHIVDGSEFQAGLLGVQIQSNIEEVPLLMPHAVVQYGTEWR